MLRKVGGFIQRALTVFGAVAIVGMAANFDPVRHWLQGPRLDIEVLSFAARREIEYLPDEGPMFDQIDITLNVIPRIRFHGLGFPVNQVRSLSIRKGEWFGAFHANRDVPFSLRDEPVSLKLTAYWVPIEGPTSPPVEIRVTDRWGRVTTAEIAGKF